MLTREDVIKRLEGLASDSLKQFNKKIIPTSKPVLGVKIPDVKRLARELSEDYSYILSVIKDGTFEEIMLYGLVIAYAQMPYPERLRYIDEYLNRTDNWAHIDCAVSAYKFIKNNREEFLTVIKGYLLSNQEFKVRFAIVCILTYYIEEEYLSLVFDVADSIDTAPYYVSMAVAWMLSVAYAKFPIITRSYLNRTKIDNLTYNRTVSKICDSYRVSKQDKDNLKTTKRKI